MTRVSGRTRLKIIILLFTLISLPACEPRALRDGHQFYKNGKYEEAINAYNQGLTKDPGSHVFNYHVGISFYKKREYEKAVEHLTRVLTIEDSDIESRANYNIGNCKYRQGELREKTDLTTTADLYQEAVDYYERAIELNEKDEEAKYNRDFVKNKLEDALSKLSKQTAETKKESARSGKKEGLPLTRETVPSSVSPAGKGADPLSRVQQGQHPQGGRKTSQTMGEGRPTRGEPIEMSKQEAEILLEGFRREEEASVEPKDRKRRSYDPDVRKDW